MTQKKKTVLAIASGICLAAAVGILLAYFGANDTEPNLVGVGEDEIIVTEVFTQPNQEQDFAYRKLVKIDNTGSVPCYIRVRLEFSSSDVQNVASFSAANQGTEDEAPEAGTFKSAQIAEGAAYYINNLPEGWVYVWEENANDYTPAVTNGYYYYTEAVPAGESTDALISWVKMQYGNVEDIQAHDLYVYAESVQTVDPNSGAPYRDWKAAWNSFAG
ncbi:MAG: hypothetical protein IJ555_14145 [Ruminococcus sp.]|nr:hypothetical protein [Ruminococcus sp.]MBR2284618.1 hypothetical protein [Ruminococcus sp.]